MTETIRPLLDDLPKPTLFVKPDDFISKEKAERQALEINKWNIYNVYRYCKRRINLWVNKLISGCRLDAFSVSREVELK